MCRATSECSVKTGGSTATDRIAKPPRRQRPIGQATHSTARRGKARARRPGRGSETTAATIATYATNLGFWVETYEPIAWAEELIDPARAVDGADLGVRRHGEGT